MHQRTIVTYLFVATLFVLLTALGTSQAIALTDKEQLGKHIFFDENLSIGTPPTGTPQSCAVCHGPKAGWTGDDPMINAHGAVYEGSINGRFGDRKPPTSAYAGNSPILHQMSNGAFVGGMFWDGRATGERLGDPLAEQALGPFLNPLEQALPSAGAVINGICMSSYAGLFTTVCGSNACDSANVDAAYDCVGYSIAAYERSADVSSYTSKYDAVQAGKSKFTKQEQAGFNLFWGKGKCNKCHTVNPRGKPTDFTDFTYDNLGVPRNPENPFYTQYAFNPLGAAWIDLGLGGFLNSQMMHPEWIAFARENFGKHKVPTLRNVAKGSCEAAYPSSTCFTKAYGHNGFFKSLKGIVHFYNTRDVKPVCPDSYTEAGALTAGCWPLPELALNMDMKLLGDLGLSDMEENALVAFLMTLSDTYTAEPPMP